MKSAYFTLIIILWGAAFAKAQLQQTLLHEFNTDDTVSISCNGAKRLQYAHLEVYTTDNGQWNGAKKPLCYELAKSNGLFGNWAISLNDSLSDKFIFISDTALNIPLQKDSVYQLNDYSWRKNCRVRDYVVMMLVERFDTTQRGYVVDTVNLTGLNSYCLCGNKYSGKIISIVMGIKPYDISLGAYALGSYASYIQRNVAVIFDTVSAVRGADTFYMVDIPAYDFAQNNIVFSNRDTNKFSTELQIIEAVPRDNPSRRVSINFIAHGGVFFQPYTALKGSVFDTVTGQRHRMQITLDGGNLCVWPYAELVIDDDNILKYQSGNIALNGKNACTMLRDRGKLVLGANSHLSYGSPKQGILGLKPGATIEFEQGAGLTINNMLLLSDYWEAPNGGEIDIYLYQGNQLIFNEGAFVSNGPFAPGSVTLNIHLKGGLLDMQHLDEQSKSLINVVEYALYQPIGNLQLYPNPTNGMLYGSFSSEAGAAITWQLFSLNGRQVMSGNLSGNSLNHQMAIDMSHLFAGVYQLVLQNGKERINRKVVLSNQL
ncbi:T9SS type A sorting domain-containing protein [bacterium]|nr:T9SS type A sorting domain-containing protein [bacterium]